MDWTYKGDVVTSINDMPSDTFGFIYKIVNNKTKEYYIGKKQVVSIRKRKFGKRELAKITDKRLKKYEMVRKEAKWQTYRSSNGGVKSWFDDKGSDVDLIILMYCKTKKELTYYELQEQVVHKVLLDDKCLNDNILGKFYRKDLFFD